MEDEDLADFQADLGDFEGCRRCLSTTSPLIISKCCDHKFCMECFLRIWSCQKPGQPSVCPIDRKAMTWILTTKLEDPKELVYLVSAYNNTFQVTDEPDMARVRLVRWLLKVSLAVVLAGLVTYYVKDSSDGE